jgi:hypothetical protein
MPSRKKAAPAAIPATRDVCMPSLWLIFRPAMIRWRYEKRLDRNCA